MFAFNRTFARPIAKLLWAQRREICVQTMNQDAADPDAMSPARDSNGFIIVAVLWILAALATLVGVYATYVANTAVAARVNNDRVQVEALVYAGLELTAYRLAAPDEKSRPTSGAFRFQLGRSQVGVAFRTEAARIDLNLAPKPMLSGLFATLGAKKEDADFIAERIIGWRKKSELTGQNDEADRYRTARLDYAPRQAPFQNVAELKLVLGMPPALAERALPFVTIFNGKPEIDVNEAAPEVVASLPFMTADIAAAILQQRDPRNPKAVIPLLGQARTSVSSEGANAARAIIRVAFETGRLVQADVVILIMDGGAEPYRILSWRDDFDGPV
jgi:general secretion pathway protein K